MGWRIELTDSAKKQLGRLDKATARRITTFLRERLALLDDPRRLGKAFTGPLRTYWRYRVGDVRDDALLVLVVRIGNRREGYR